MNQASVTKRVQYLQRFLINALTSVKQLIAIEKELTPLKMYEIKLHESHDIRE